jgi:hypothetical protein
MEAVRVEKLVLFQSAFSMEPELKIIEDWAKVSFIKGYK